jgi:hypothetical protein
MSSPTSHGEESSGEPAGAQPGAPAEPSSPGPEAAQPAGPEGASAEPTASGPGEGASAEPEAAEPTAAQPAAEPTGAESGAAEPTAAGSGPAESGAAEPVTTDPTTAEPDVVEAEAPPVAPPAPPPAASEPATADEVPSAPQHSKPTIGTGPLRILGLLVILGGLILMVAGGFTWYVVRDQLSDEKITVSDDADRFAGDPVDGPFTAYEQARVINKHALAESDGLTYAQLDQDDPRRDTVMTASFLRASLYTSVVSFGVAFFAFGMGILMILIGWALLSVNKRLRAALS